MMRPAADHLFISLPNDTLYTTMCFLWGGEMASCSQVCRELYNVIGETVVSGFLVEFGGRHPRRMMRNVLFRMYEKVRVRSMSNMKGIMLWSSHHGYLRAVRGCIADERWHAKLKIRRPSDGATPLFLAAEQNNLPIVRALCARGVEINLGTFEGFSPLHAAAREGHASVARFLIGAKADLTKTDSSGYSPMMLAAGQGHAKIVRLLAEAGVRVDVATKIFKSDADQGGETALHRACEKGHAEMVGLLLDMDKSGSMINSVTGQGRTSLITAAEEGQQECVQILLEKGANVHITTKAGKGALYLACERGHVEIVKQLLEAGADPGQYTCRKKIPLYTAAEQGNLAMVKVLLPFTTKAHLFIETTYGTTPLFIATRSGNGDVKDLLVDFCSRGKKKVRACSLSFFLSLSLSHAHTHAHTHTHTHALKLICSFDYV
jgi:ankyrin repeat protein